MSPPLITALPFIEGETLSGYVSRSAKLHETRAHDFCSDLGMHWPFICSGYDDQIKRLAWLTGEPLNLLRNWRIEQVGVGYHKIGQAFASKGVLRRTAVRLCPKCVSSALQESGPSGVFQLLEWSVLCIERCAQHGCPLITLPAKGHSHAIYDFVSRILEHPDEIKRAADSNTSLASTRFETYVRDRIWHGPADDWLREFDLMLIHRASLTLGAALSGVSNKQFNHIADEDLRNFCEAGFEQLVGGPDTYNAALHVLRRQGTAGVPSYAADMGPHFQWLRDAQDEPAMNEMVAVICKFVVDNYAMPSGKKVLGKSPKRRKWLTIDEARKRTGCGIIFLKKLLAHLDGTSEAEAFKRTEVHVNELPKVRAYMNGLINLRDAAAQLGILPRQVKGLQDLGVLSTIRIASSLRYLSREEIEQLLVEVNEIPVALEGRPVAPLKEYCRTKGVPLTRVVDMWRRGELEGKICRGNGKGLQAIEVDLEAVFNKPKVELIPVMTLPEAASYLKISIIAIRQLRNHGYLTQIRQKNPDTKHMHGYVTQSSIQEFERTYITLGQMASERNMAAIHLAQQLDRASIDPITCGAKLVRVYERNVVGWGQTCNG